MNNRKLLLKWIEMKNLMNNYLPIVAFSSGDNTQITGAFSVVYVTRYSFKSPRIDNSSCKCIGLCRIANFQFISLRYKTLFNL